MNPTTSQPIKPLKILTIDGGGLQAVSTLLILNELLEKIAVQNGHPNRKPRPCDVFDTIAGIGAGGWLAILLGRFRLDITSCLSEWYKITQRIVPRSRKRKLRMRVFQHCYFDQDSLIAQIDRLTELYDAKENQKNLLERRPQDVRTRHVFVAALKSDASGYNLFRTYEIPPSPQLPGRMLKGPQNPSTFKISSAFGVTGAAKYFAPKWKELVAGSGEIAFRDTKFPKPHNITELALDEMWGIYGTAVPLSVVVNIGPGRPQDIDIRQITRRFSWGKSGSRASKTSSLSQTSPGTESEQSRRPLVSPIRTNTVGSVKDRSFDTKLKRLEKDIEHDIRKKLDELYPDNSGYYFRLGLDKAPKGTAQNDSSSSGVVSDATSSYLQDAGSQSTLNSITDRYSTSSIVDVCA